MVKKLPKTTGDGFVVRFHDYDLLLTPSELRKSYERYQRHVKKGKLVDMKKWFEGKKKLKKVM